MASAIAFLMASDGTVTVSDLQSMTSIVVRRFGDDNEEFLLIAANVQKNSDDFKQGITCFSSKTGLSNLICYQPDHRW